MPSQAVKSTPAAAEKPHGYEFFGPPGAFVISFGVPIVLYLMTFACNDISGCPAPALLSPRSLDWQVLKTQVGWPQDGIWGLCSWRVMGWTLAYYLYSAVLHRFLPGEVADGVVLSNGGRLKYRCNTFITNVFTLSICLAGTIAQGAYFPLWTFMTDNYVELLSANVIIAFAQATFVYVRSFSVRPGDTGLRELAAGGHTGNMLYDWFIGRELNPRVTLPILGEIDIKFFMELRPGMLGWMLYNCAFVAKQYRTFGYVTDSIVFITLIQGAYVLDSEVMESSILTTIDITTDGFGMMLSVGDIVWVPFFYSSQTRYLATHPQKLGFLGLTVMGTVLLLGYSIFRLTNNQKNTFRTNPNDPRVAHLKYIETRTGSKLLITGWWGVARHINYCGDWIQAWPYSLPTGMAGYLITTAGTNADEGAVRMLDGREVVPGAARGWGIIFTYFYIVYFAVLLVHRERRDDLKCARKYGDDWSKYKSIVKTRIVPFIY